MSYGTDRHRSLTSFLLVRRDNAALLIDARSTDDDDYIIGSVQVSSVRTPFAINTVLLPIGVARSVRLPGDDAVESVFASERVTIDLASLHKWMPHLTAAEMHAAGERAARVDIFRIAGVVAAFIWVLCAAATLRIAIVTIRRE